MFRLIHMFHHLDLMEQGAAGHFTKAIAIKIAQLN